MTPRSWLAGAIAAAVLATSAAQGAERAGVSLRDLIGATRLGERADLFLGADDEVAAGRNVAASLLAVAPLVDDDGLQRYVNEIGRWVASQSERPDLPWRFGVVDVDGLNAFAIPGGYVIVTRGLYEVLEDPSALAGVLAHEISHVAERHHLQVGLAARVVDAGVSRVDEKLEGEARQLMSNVLGAGASMLTRKLDRRTEFAADRMAVVLAARAGFDPWGLPSVLARLARVPEDSDRLALLLSTHPPPSARLQQLDRAMSGALERYAKPDAGGALYALRREP